MIKKVLIVEDNYLVQEQLKEILTSVFDKIKVKHAFSHSEALDLFPQEMPEYVLMDISLTGGNSLAFLQRFKTMKPETKVILMVNFPPNEFIMKCMDLGADDFFEKSNIYSLLHSSSKNRITVN